MKVPYTLAIGSFAVHGTASLKTFITFLGEKILPVPSLLLNGLTNMSLVKKFEPPFHDLLKGTFELATSRNLDLILYIGYLGNASQADTILEMIATYRSAIKTIIADPVCGDHGRSYVPEDVIQQWPKIISKSDMAFPNITELKILTGHHPQDSQSLDEYVARFSNLFPTTRLIVTSVKSSAGSIGIELHGENPFLYYLPILQKDFGGTGDALVSQFILNHFYFRHSVNDALRLATDKTHCFIEHSIEKGSDDLILKQRMS
jgi:pyridoxal/pyridoxine/pyridoxamine kinase